MGASRARYHVGGMACSFCAGSIEAAYDRTDGVGEVDVSLAHEEVLVRYDDERVDEVTLRDTLRDLGYTLRDPDRERRFEQQRAELAAGKRRLLLAGAFAGVTAALMLWMVFGRGVLESRARWMDLTALALALSTALGPGRYILRKAVNSLRRGILNQHVLLEAGAFAGLAGGVLGLTVFPSFPAVHFFAVTVFVTTYHVLSEYTSLLVRTRASQAVRDLLDLRPDTARRVGAEGGTGTVEEVPVEDLAVGDRVRVKPGETVPVDGEVVDGESAVDESVATGESAPVDRTPGEEVVGGSIARTGTLLVEVTATGEDAFLNRVARAVEEARATKPGVVRLADRVLGWFVPGVLAVAALSALFWTVAPPLWGGAPDGQRGVFAALAVLVLGYPCALGMATPLALIRGGGRAAKRGVLLRSAAAFQVLPDVDRVCFDKTGTLTVGDPAVTTVVAVAGDEADVLATAATAEAFSDHPLAAAVRAAADECGLTAPDPETFEAVTGKGVRATVDGPAGDSPGRESGEGNDENGSERDRAEILVGKPDWLAAEGVDLAPGRDAVERLQGQGLTVSAVARDGDLVGLVGLGDEPKPDAATTVEALRAAGVEPVLVTGDGEPTARAVAGEVGIERVLADVLPGEKRAAVRRLQAAGHRVAMVGDGINDAPALTQADVGIAVGAGTDIAIESAGVVLVGDRLAGVTDAREIAAESYRTTKQNLAAAVAFNGVGVAAATTGLVHPVVAMVAMVLSVSAVLANSFGTRLLTGDVDARFAVDREDPPDRA